MSNAWDIKSDDLRKEDSLPTFIIFCEDKVSEPHYFQYFATQQIKIITIGEQKQNIQNVARAISYCEENGIMQTKDGLCYIVDENPMIWCVFDRDCVEDTEQNKIDNVLFDESLVTAKQKGFNVAWSNDAFELWILLHFDDIDVTEEKHKNRKAYYDRLTEILKALPNPNSELVKALKHESFHYKKDFKSANNFKQIIIPEIVGKTSVAIERAKRIEAHFADKNILNHKKAPCTMVHHLVEELIRLGGKEI